jgi:Type II secretion system (T2SS), protein E, N-terminal domain
MRELLNSSMWPGKWGKRWRETQAKCELLSCTGSSSLWQRIWHGSNGFFLQGLFYCQPQCLEAALAGQLQRLEALAPAPPPPSRIPLGLLMVARGRLTHEQVVAALAAQESAGSGKIGDWFEKLGFATEAEVTSALGLQWGCPVAASFDPGSVPPIGRIPLAILEAFQMLPLRHAPSTNTLYLVFGERVDHAALYAIEKILDCQTQPCVAERKTVAGELERRRQQSRPDEVEFGPMRDIAEMTRIGASYMARLGADDARVGRVGPFIWLRLSARTSHTNLTFRVRVAAARTRYAPAAAPMTARMPSPSPASLR